MIFKISLIPTLYISFSLNEFILSEIQVILLMFWTSLSSVLDSIPHMSSKTVWQIFKKVNHLKSTESRTVTLLLQLRT